MGEATSWQMPSFDDLLPNAGAAPAAAPVAADAADAATEWQMPSFDDLMPKQSLPAALGNTAMSGLIGSAGLAVAAPSRMHLAADKGYANAMLRAVEALASDESAAYQALTPVQRGVLTAYRHATPERQAECQPATTSREQEADDRPCRSGGVWKILQTSFPLCLLFLVPPVPHGSHYTSTRPSSV